MKLFVPFRRATLLVPSGPTHDPDQKHLFILLTDPVQVLDYKGKHSLLVGVTTIHAGIPYDLACELHAGDHPFIKHKSFVFYAEARIEASQKLVDGVKRGVFSHQGMLVEDISRAYATASQYRAPPRPKSSRFTKPWRKPLAKENRHNDVSERMDGESLIVQDSACYVD